MLKNWTAFSDSPVPDPVRSGARTFVARAVGPLYGHTAHQSIPKEVHHA